MKKKGFKKAILMILTCLMLFTSFVGTVEAANNYIIGDGKKSQWSVRLDSPHFSGDVYHLHFYNYNTHVYCMRLDNLQTCDNNKSNRDKVPNWLIEKAMKDSRVQNKVKSYNPTVANNSGLIKVLLILGTGILVVLAAINIFAGPVDDVAAWSMFLSALAS